MLLTDWADPPCHTAGDVWPTCNLPIHVALIGVAISHRVAVLTAGQVSKAAAQRAATLEAWAFGAMEMATSEGEKGSPTRYRQPASSFPFR